MPRQTSKSASEGKTRRNRGPSLAAAPPAAINQAEAYGVRVVPAQVAPGQSYWRIVRVRHLPPEENRGKHNLYVDAQDESGARVRNSALRIGWTWEGRHANQEAPPKPLDKPDNEPAGNVDVNTGQHIEAWIEGDGLPSDRVAHVHTDHPDEPAPSGDLWNTIGHHSFHVVFQRTVAESPKVEPTPAFHFAVWPTEVRTITQAFGAQPEYYSQWDLPGHEGVDIAAPNGGQIFCVAPGTVKLVHQWKPNDAKPHNYGNHVRVEHQGGYETIYAHLQSFQVQEGQQVQAGQVLGLADATGNASGNHLHLTLKHAGETQGNYPHNIIDPTPYLQALLTAQVDGAVYVSDTIMDGTPFQPSTTFQQVWRLRNSGTSAWGEGYSFALFSGDALGAPSSVPLPAAAPGQEVSVSVTFRAPVAAGRYRSIWRCRNTAGAWFGERVWVEIVVSAYQPISGQVTPRAKLGIDGNLPIGGDGRIALRLADPTIIADTGVGWVRLNFVRGPWSGPKDTKLHEGRTWEQTYRQIIDGLRSKNLRIYGLISDEAVSDPENRFRDPTSNGSDARQWISDYIETFHTIAHMFRDQVEVFESFNEPDDWKGQDKNWVHPKWFAVMLQEIWDRMKRDPETAGIRIVSGPLQGLHDNGNAGHDYLRRTYEAGRSRYGWGEAGVPFPFDGVGHHLYIAQAAHQEPEQDVPAVYNQYMNEVRRVIQEHEGGAKPIFISEMGWQSSRIGEDKHARCLKQGLRCLLEDPSVALGIWFCTEDWSETWGLYRVGNLSAGGRKPAHAALQALCREEGKVTAAQWQLARAAMEPVFAPPVMAPELPTWAELAPQEPAKAAALGIIYTTYWLRALAAPAAPDPQQALRTAADDALAQIKEWTA